MTLIGEGQQAPFNPEVLLRLMEESEDGEYFHLVSGEVGARGETTVVGISSYHAPMPDLLNMDSLKKHYGLSRGFLIDNNGEITEANGDEPFPSAEVTLEIPSDAKYAFDTGDPSIRLLIGSIKYDSETVLVRIARIDFGNRFSDFWIHKDN